MIKTSCCFLRKWFFSLHDQNVFGWFDVSTCNGQLHIRLNLIGVTFRYKSSVGYFRCGIQENTSYWKFWFNNKENKFWKIKKEFKKWGKEINVSFCALALGLCTFCNLEKKKNFPLPFSAFILWRYKITHFSRRLIFLTFMTRNRLMRWDKKADIYFLFSKIPVLPLHRKSSLHL